jgi:hypothetical protein
VETTSLGIDITHTTLPHLAFASPACCPSAVVSCVVRPSLEAATAAVMAAESTAGVPHAAVDGDVGDTASAPDTP